MIFPTVSTWNPFYSFSALDLLDHDKSSFLMRQLRVHCAEALGTPMVGDYKYGWQSHRKWKPIPWSNPETERERLLKQKPSYGLKLEGGSITEKKPHLHLHCREMVLPNVSLALQQLQSSTDPDFSNLEKLTLVAPLPPHMQRSWEILMPQKVPHIGRLWSSDWWSVDMV